MEPRWASALVGTLIAALVAGGAAASGTGGRSTAGCRSRPPELATAASVAETFVETAVRRTHVGRSYDLVTSSLRQGQTRAQWSRGTIAVIPISQASIESARLIVYRPARHVTTIAWLAVIAGREAGVRSHWSFRIDLVKRLRRWLVDYWAPAPAAAWLAPSASPPLASRARVRCFTAWYGGG